MRSYLRSLFLLLLANGTLLAGESIGFAQQHGPAYGPPPPPPPGYYRPRRTAPAYYYAPGGHNSLFLQLTAGVGYLTASDSVSGGDITYSGFGFSGNLAMGGAISPNLILYGELLLTSIVDADESSNGIYQGYSGLDLTSFGLGPGVAYYFEPLNLYLAGTLAFSKVYFSNTGDGYPAGDTNWGLGGAFKVGKEWWLAPRWSIGLAGMFHVASMKDPVAGANMTATTFALLFSASFG